MEWAIITGAVLIVILFNGIGSLRANVVKDLKVLEDALNSMQRSIEGLESIVENLCSSNSDLENQIDDIRNRLNEAVGETLNSVQTSIEELEREVREIDSSHWNIENKADDVTKKLDWLQSDLNQMNRRLIAINSEIDEFRNRY